VGLNWELPSCGITVEKKKFTPWSGVLAHEQKDPQIIATAKLNKSRCNAKHTGQNVNSFSLLFFILSGFPLQTTAHFAMSKARQSTNLDACKHFLSQLG